MLNKSNYMIQFQKQDNINWPLEVKESKYSVVIYPASKGGYVAEVPAFAGCLAQGENLEPNS